MEDNLVLLCFFQDTKFILMVTPSKTGIDDLVGQINLKLDSLKAVITQQRPNGIICKFSVGSLNDVCLTDDYDVDVMFRHADQVGSNLIEINISVIGVDVDVTPNASATLCKPTIEAVMDGDSCFDVSDHYGIEDLTDDEGKVEDLDSEEEGTCADYLDKYCRHPDKVLKTEPWKRAITKVGQIFLDGSAKFKLELAKYAIVSGFQYDYKKNEPHRVSADCKFKNSLGCEWSILARYNKSQDYFYIRKLQNKHTCNRIYQKLHDYRMGCDIIADEVFKKLNHNSVISPKDIVNEFREDYGMEIDYNVVWRGVQAAKTKFFGIHSSTYDQLNCLVEATKSLNQGTEMFLEKDPINSRFQRFFVAYGPCLEGFQYCRPLLFLDGTFLKSRYKGTLLAATAKDANNGLYPVAFAVVDSETIDNWTWFLRSLSQCINRDRLITFISDRNKGILEAASNVFPDSPHGFCMLHLRANLKDKLGGTPREIKKQILALLWKAAQTPFKDECMKYITEMISCNAKVQDFINNAPIQNWTNSHFVGTRYGELYSNAAESFNSWIRNERNLPVKNMVDDIRRKLMTRMTVRRKLSAKVTTIICPKYYQWLLKAREKGLNWFVKESNQDIFEVMSDPSVVVNLKERTCSCNKWQIRGFPCSHSIAAILNSGKDIMDFVEDYCKASYWYKAHENSILPTPTLGQHIHIHEEMQVLPPITKIPPGRPRKLRYTSRSERFSKKRPMTCSRCKQKGNHTKRSCKTSIQD